jgi:hypothetical protein
MMRDFKITKNQTEKKQFSLFCEGIKKKNTGNGKIICNSLFLRHKNSKQAKH